MRPVSPAEDRLAMVRAAIAGLDGAECSEVEVGRPGPSYTADTLAELAQSEPGSDLVLLVGADAARSMPTWERLDEVLSQCTVAMIDRPEDEPGGPEAENVPPWVRARVRIPLLAISSTELRRRVRTGEPRDYLVPSDVISGIDDRGLYREPFL